jgi:hypothetical protein
MQPQTTRWTAPDPAVKGPDKSATAEPWNLNPYAYALNMPSLFWDPDGRAPRYAPKGMHYVRNPVLGEDYYIPDPPRPPSHRIKAPKGEMSGPKGTVQIEGTVVKGGKNPNMMVQLPARGVGFINHSEPLSYTRQETANKIVAAAAEFHKLTDGEYVLSIGHMGLPGGGTTVDPDHKEHDEGLTVDIVIREAAGKHKKIDMMSSDPKLVGVMNAALKAFNDSKVKGIEVDRVLFNNPNVPGPSDAPKHDDHMDFRFRLTEENKPE